MQKLAAMIESLQDEVVRQGLYIRSLEEENSRIRGGTL